HKQNNSIYKKLVENQNPYVKKQPENWKDIPLVSTELFKTHKLFCLEEKQITKKFFSSGTSSTQRSTHYLSAEELRLYEASLWQTFSKAFNLQAQRPINYLVLTETPEQLPNSSLVHMFETVKNKLNIQANCYFVDNEKVQIEKLENHLKEINKNLTTLVVGTAFSFVNWVDASSYKFNLPSNFMVMETGGYKGRSREVPKKDLYELISQKLGVPQQNIIGQYGMSELGSQFYDLNVQETNQSEQRLKHIPAWCKVRILNPENLQKEMPLQENGLIAIYDLCNMDSMPFVLTGDIGQKINETCFEILGRANKLTPKGCSLMING
ncbi:MAG TPA: hypothetical protein V6C96_03620, partial [Vampirovibrionales bacterium]